MLTNKDNNYKGNNSKWHDHRQHKQWWQQSLPSCWKWRLSGTIAVMITMIMFKLMTWKTGTRSSCYLRKWHFHWCSHWNKVKTQYFQTTNWFWSNIIQAKYWLELAKLLVNKDAVIILNMIPNELTSVNSVIRQFCLMILRWLHYLIVMELWWQRKLTIGRIMV